MVVLKRFAIIFLSLVVPGIALARQPIVSRPTVLPRGHWMAEVDMDIGVVHGRSFKDFYFASHEPLKRESGLVIGYGFARGFDVGLGVSPYVADRRGKRFGAVHGHVRARILKWLAGEVGVSAPAWGLFDEAHTSKVGLWLGLPLHVEVSRGGFAVFLRPDLVIGLSPQDKQDPAAQLRVQTDLGLGLNVSPELYLELSVGYHQVVHPVRRLELPVGIAISYSFKSGIDLRGALVFWNLHPDLGLSATHFRGISLSLCKYW